MPRVDFDDPFQRTEDEEKKTPRVSSSLSKTTDIDSIKEKYGLTDRPQNANLLDIKKKYGLEEVTDMDYLRAGAEPPKDEPALSMIRPTEPADIMGEDGLARISEGLSPIEPYTGAVVEPEELGSRYDQYMEEYEDKLRELDTRQTLEGATDSSMYEDVRGLPEGTQIAGNPEEEKLEMLQNPPNQDDILKELRAEKAASYIAKDDTSEDAWMDYMANTLDPQEFTIYQTQPGYAAMKKAAVLPEIQYTEAVKERTAELDEMLPGGEAVADVLMGLWSSVRSAQASGLATTGLGLGAVADKSPQELIGIPGIGQNLAVASALAGATGMKDTVGEASDLAMEQAGDVMMQSQISREAVTQGRASHEFLYDLSATVPDMLVSVGATIATGGGAGLAKLTTKELAKEIVENKMSKTIAKEMLARMVISPGSLPLAAKSFGLQYANNIQKGWDGDKAATVALIAAYGEGVLEGGGVQQSAERMLASKGSIPDTLMDQAVNILKDGFGEGFEEVTQNYWEEAVYALVDPDDEFETAFPTEEALIGFVAGTGTAAAVSAPGMYRTATQPYTTQPDVTELATQQADYQQAKAEYDDFQTTKAKTSEPGEPQLLDYQDVEYSTKEIKAAANRHMPQLIEAYKKDLSTAEAETMDEVAINEALAATINNEVVLGQIEDGTLPEGYMDQLRKDAFNKKPRYAEPEAAEPTAMQEAIEKTGYEPEAPVAPSYEPTVDTSRMTEAARAKMEANVATLSTDQKTDIKDLALLGRTRSEISKGLGIKPGVVKSFMQSTGIPDVKSAEYQQWRAAQAIPYTVKSQEVQKKYGLEADVPQTVTGTQAQERIDADPILNKVGAKVADESGVAAFSRLRNLGRSLGTEVVFFDAKDKAMRAVVGGYIEGKMNTKQRQTIFINSDKVKEGADVALEVIGHEFLHSIRMNHKDLYAGMREAIGEGLSAEQVQKVLEGFEGTSYYDTLNADRELLIEEVLADEAGSIFTDSAFWQRLSDRDESVAKRLIRQIRKFIQRILGDKRPSRQLGVLEESQVKEFEKRFEDAVAEVSKRVERGEVAGAEMADGTAQPTYSIRSYQNTDLEAMKEDIVKSGFSEEVADDYMDSLKTVAALVLENPDLQYESADGFTPVKPNSDKLYTISLDFSTLCKKRLPMQATLNAIHTAKGQYLTAAEIMQVRTELAKRGVEVACGLCYVDSARLGQAKHTQELIDNWQDAMERQYHLLREKRKAETAYQPARDRIKEIKAGRTNAKLKPADFEAIEAARAELWPAIPADMQQDILDADPALMLTDDGQAQMAQEFPEVYTMAAGIVRSKTRAKGVEPRAEYVPGMLLDTKNVSDGLVKKLNRNAGMRMQSWSDFELVHMLDMMQAIGDMSQRGLKSHMYTKVPDAVRTLGHTGVMINTSIIPKGATGFDSKGELIFDPVEGMDFNESQALRAQFPNTVGNIAIGVNDDQILAMMKDPRIDFIIPYHASGLSNDMKQIIGGGIDQWWDYTKVQEEKGKGDGPLLSDYWDYSNTGEQNVVNYLNFVRKAGLTPKFFGLETKAKTYQNLLLGPAGVKAWDAGQEITANMVREGSWKLLIDRKMFNNNGEAIVQAPVEPVFEDAVLSNMLRSYDGKPKSAMANQEVVDMFTSGDRLSIKKEFNAKGLSDTDAGMATDAIIESSRNVVTTVAKDYTEKFISNGKVDFLGETIEDSEALAYIAQVARNPKFETLRYIFVDESMRVVDQQFMSARVPGAVQIYPDADFPSMGVYMNEAFINAEKRGAHGYYILHNHPSGDPSPSAPDIAMTKKLAGVTGNRLIMLDHVVINSSRYAVIDEEGNVTQANLQVEDRMHSPEVPHSLLGQEISGPDSMSRIAKSFQASDEVSMVIYRGGGGVIRGIHEISNDLLTEPGALKRLIDTHALEFGTFDVAVVTNAKPIDTMEDMEFYGYVVDFVTYGGSSARAAGAYSPGANTLWPAYPETRLHAPGTEFDRYSIRTKPAPKKTIKAYKLMRVDPRKPGQLFPLFVDANKPADVGVWLDADVGDTTTTKTGATKVKSKLGPLAYRPGWHLGDVPLATHIGKKEPGAPRSAPIAYMDPRHVWVEAEVAADVDYQSAANEAGIHEKTGKFSAARADLKYLPEDGFYRYKTNPNMTGNWIITGAIKLTRVLSDEEAGQIVRDAGLEPLPRFGGAMDWAKYGFDPTTDRFSLGEPTIDISMEGAPESDRPGFFKRMYRRLVNRDQPISELSREALVRAANSRVVSGTVENIAFGELTDTEGNTLGKSLQDLTKDYADDKQFWMYMAQLHNIDRAREGRPVDPGMTSEQSAEWVAKQDLIHPEYAEYAAELTGWIDTFMEAWGVDSGVIDPDLYNDLRAMYPNYFPTQREFTDLEDMGQGYMPGRRFADQASPIKKATGSERDISNPLGNIMQMVNSTVRTARYNEVGQTLIDVARAGSDLITEVPYAEAMFSKQADNVISVWEDGAPTYLEIHDETLLESIQGLPRVINNAPNMRKITGLYKGLITSNNPLFAIRNMFRDIPTAYVYGSQNNPLTFGAHLLRAFGGELGIDPKYREASRLYRAMGGAGAGQFHSFEAAKAAKVLRPSAASKLKAPIRAIQKLNEITELAPRISEFQAVLDRTGDVHEALYAAQNVTVDFARGGDITKAAEPFVPYLNASVQGLDRFVQAFNFKKDPAGALGRMVKAGVAITAPQIVSYMMSTALQPDEYEELSQRTKDAYFVFPKGDGTFYRIPKSRELGVLFGALFERGLTGNLMGADNAADIAGLAATNFGPVNPLTSNFFSPALGMMYNRDWAGRPIESYSMLGMSPENRYDANTSEIGKAIGQYSGKAGISPEEVDYLIDSYTGVIGDFILPATTGRKGPMEALDATIVRPFIGDPVFSSQNVTDFYDRMDQAEFDKNDIKAEQGTQNMDYVLAQKKYSQLSKISSLSSTANKAIRDMDADDPGVREIKAIVSDYMGRANDTDDFVELAEIAAAMEIALYRKGVY